MTRRLLLALGGLLALACVSVVVSGHDLQQPANTMVRGIKQRDADRYGQATFTCFDGSATIPAAQINDEYCDCLDGSDEPGTSACVNSRFWCPNRGAKGKSLPSSRVNDGVCDCCDGSDEGRADGSSPCPNTCEEAGRSAREALVAEIASTEAGVAARAALLVSAREALDVQRAKLERYEKLLAERVIKRDAALAVKEAEEAVEQAERTRREEAARVAAQEAAAAAGTTVEAEIAPEAAATEAPADTLEATIATPDTPEVPAAEATPAAAAATEVTPEAPKENFPYPPEYAYHATDDAAAKAEEGEKPVENFPYPAEYAFKAEGTGEAAEDGMVEPEYSDAEGERDQQGPEDGDEDEDDATDQTEQQATEETEFVHPGAAATGAATAEPAATTTADDASAPSVIASGLAWLTSSIVGATTSLLASEVYTSAYWQSTLDGAVQSTTDLVTGNFDLSVVRARWSRRAWSALESLGEATIDLISHFEERFLGTDRFEAYVADDEQAKPTATATAASNQFVHPGAEAARVAFDAADTKVTRLEGKIEKLKKAIGRDYGPDAAFHHMDGACYSLQVKQYTYEICPYVSAKQKEGHSSTSLGSWDSLSVVDGVTVMKFTGGQGCWQGPARSLTVKLRCGGENKVLSVDEPSKCVYEMAMETPAICEPQHALALKLNLEGGGLIEEEDEE